MVSLLVGAVVDEIGEENPDSDIKLKQYVESSTNSCWCDL